MPLSFKWGPDFHVAHRFNSFKDKKQKHFLYIYRWSFSSPFHSKTIDLVKLLNHVEIVFPSFEVKRGEMFADTL